MLIYVLSINALAAAWMLISGQLTVESLLIGLVLGTALITLRRPGLAPLRLRNAPLQAAALVTYVMVMLRDIVISSIALTRRVLSRDMGLQPGILAVPTQDEERNFWVLALSANYITLTPGELVVEIIEDQMMYVHCLDIEASKRRAAADQARRLRLLRRIMGRDE